jgi:hypothetical protein
MNPLDPKIGHALKEIEAVYAGKKSAHAYYDHAKKVYVLVVSGEDAEAYHNIIRGIHDLAEKGR